MKAEDVEQRDWAMKHWNRRAGQAGAAAIEVALLLPLVVFLIFGIIELTVLLYDQAMITNASREGARAGIVYDADGIPDQDIITVVENYCSDHLISFGGASLVSTNIARSGTGAGDELTVTVSYHYDFLVLPNFIASFTGGVNLDARTVMSLE